MNEEARRIVTLIGELQARVGYRFVHSEPPRPCKACRFFHVCVGVLEPGRLYEVVAVRRLKHECPLHEGGVRVVEVVEAPVEAALPSKMAVEGLIVHYRPPSCELSDCRFTPICRTKWLRPGDRCKVVEVLEARLPCPRGLDLAQARLLRLPPS